MKSLLNPGTYIVAVSGGIDSVALLHMLHHQQGHKLIVAHVDHGIRTDSADDAAFVRQLASLYDIAYEERVLSLGPNASEGEARRHRYDFLRQLKDSYAADAIVTAHHQDDLIETAAINMLRGTMRRGLVSLRSRSDLRRPLLELSKADIRDYVVGHQLEWQEDSTNLSDKYLRNRVRARLHRSLNLINRAKIIELLQIIESDNTKIDSLISEYLAAKQMILLRDDCRTIDAPVLFEIVAEWLRRHDAVFDKNTIVRICNGARTLQTGAKIDVDKRYYCLLSRTEIILTRR